MFHYRLIELEAELLAKQQSQKGLSTFTPLCAGLLDFIEQEIGIRLGDPILAHDWQGWLCYRRTVDRVQSLLVARGRAFQEGALKKWRAGLDVPYGADTITEYRRGFDVSPPQDLDHLLINFGGDPAKVFLWYGENIAPYKIIFMESVDLDPHHQLSDAVVEACTWILTRPKDITLSQFLLGIAKSP
jgi:hypothetical protein